MRFIVRNGVVGVCAVAAAMLSSCRWAGMESRLADRVGGTSDEMRIVSSECPDNCIVEHTLANGKKIYVQRCRVVAERKSGALFVFGGISDKHFSLGKGGESGVSTTVEKSVVIGYRDLVLSGLAAPPAEQQHELGKQTMLWEEWQAECAKRNDPSLRIVSSTSIPVSAVDENDFAAWEVFKTRKPQQSSLSRYVYVPLAKVVDVPMTVLGSACYLPYYNVKTWINGEDKDRVQPENQ